MILKWTQPGNPVLYMYLAAVLDIRTNIKKPIEIYIPVIPLEMKTINGVILCQSFAYVL